MKRILDELPKLAVDGGSPEGSPVLDQPEDTDHLTVGKNIYDTPKRMGIKRTDTNDSLHNLVGRSPNLSHIQGISSLPSPIVLAKSFAPETKPRNQETGSVITCSSPLQREYSAHDERPEVAAPSGKSNKTLSHGIMPAKLFARLQKEAHSSRTASLSVAQNLDAMEMPRIVRHRSQTEVDLAQNVMHREESNDKQSGNYRPQANNRHAIFADREDEVYDVYCDGEWRRFVVMDELGQGTFSRVLLAREKGQAQRLVAVKVVDLLSTTTAERARVDTTVRREIELLEQVSSPLLIRLHGYNITEDRALLVLDYLPGGDLFTLTAEHRSLLTVPMVRRIFAELVCAVRTLHRHNIVHRDLKLENVLLRGRAEGMRKTSGRTGLWTTLTDLGLARSFDPEGPDLTTRCGSEDYAAPEIIMGQSYDGRQTDGWALGVLLYTMLEGRLPFDVIPGLEHKMQSRVLHRICRIEWRWVRLKEAGSYDVAWNGAKRVVGNLLRSRTKRWSLDDVAEDDWLRDDVVEVEALVSAAQT
ncbi:putative Protein kinase [Taphrina deformans PYCC 5710]|uniref:Protein kinase domain-containing protein n=1 Tax=Taphrina deformans (strain PYCC 5710 / ATCC 11124 / CBS 356.35 / IMI 108563 / JCM 9778 / NBRC 8474) TaxID=1097556 RepID=R4X998_TAPDE|nr:putative Protein kinase [Taphrina deformans PYCC 5710]|eukprot:CCG80757.1 putative Protein kinase [Taphrina deformans PYCC 5710]